MYMWHFEENTTLFGISELRTKLTELIAALKTSKVILAIRRKPFAVLISIKRYKEIEALLELVEDRSLGYIATIRNKEKESNYYSLDDVEKKLKVR